MQTNREQPTPNEASWTTALWMFVVALIGFSFAIYRFIQFSAPGSSLKNVRLTRIELYIFRAIGPWGIIAIFVVMGIFGLYNAISNIRALRSRKR